MRLSNLRVRLRTTPKAVVLFSGGLDSAVTLAIAAEDDGCEVYPLAFNYGQSNHVELRRAQEQLKARFSYAHPLRVCAIDYPTVAPHCGMLNPALKADFGEMDDIWVPYRNVVFLMLAGAYAESVGANYIYTGIQNESPAAIEAVTKSWRSHVDAHPGIVEDMQFCLRAYSRGSSSTVELRAPLVQLDKASIIQLADSYGIQRDTTWSCLRGEVTPCGTCVSCKQISRVVDVSP